MIYRFHFKYGARTGDHLPWRQQFKDTFTANVRRGYMRAVRNGVDNIWGTDIRSSQGGRTKPVRPAGYSIHFVKFSSDTLDIVVNFVSHQCRCL